MRIIRWLAALTGLLSVAAFAAIGDNAASTQSAGTVIIDGVAVVDVVNGVVRSPMRVMVRSGRIVAVERAPRIGPPLEGDSVIDGRGKFLIPGLWDMHVHIDTTEAWFFPLAIAAGVTSVRDMGGLLSRVREWKAPAKPGVLRPTIIASGPIVTGPIADTDSRLARVTSPAQASRAVDALLDRGVDFIKVHDWLSRDSYLAVTTEARRRGSYVAGHLPIAVDPVDAARARQRSIEHMGNGWSGLLLFASADRHLIDSVSKWANVETGTSGLMKHFTPSWQRRLADNFSTSRARSLCGTLAGGGVWLTPTTYFSAYLTLMPLDSSIVRDPRLNYLPRSIRDQTQDVVPKERFSRAARRSPNVGVYEARARLIRICRDQGVRFLAGTDTGPYGPMIPGFSLHDELARFVADGFTPLQALQAATINPARFFRATDTTGSVSPGKRADLVLLDANPLTNINNIRRINAVIVNGTLIDQPHRQQMLDSLAAKFATQ
ncbi:MAG TPA: amidohydrolase family protein [Gemmatimonadaceae bacterium]|nr:amidohydrolase family protein [Gemmatimonadaceae bacterium]